MEEHLAFAKANLDLARAQYTAAQALYKNALKLSKDLQSSSRAAQNEAVAGTHSDTEPQEQQDTVVDLTRDGNDAQAADTNDAQAPDTNALTTCESCRTSLLPKCFTENTWPRSSRVTLCSFAEAVSKTRQCELCHFLADASRLLAISRPTKSAVKGVTTWTVGSQIRMVQGSSRTSWPKIAGCTLDASVNPFAWLELSSCPQIWHENATYICVSLELDAGARSPQSSNAICGPRIRSEEEQSSGLVDYDLIKAWINICTTHHGSECHGLHDIDNAATSSTPTYLIDLKTRHIAAAQPGARYVAVSYVWGKDAPQSRPAAPQENSELPMDVSDLEWSSQMPDKIPQTLEDALTVARAIGADYAWIDQYCIDQENAAQVKKQVAQMDRVYREAWLTVIALDSVDANAGIPGISRPMQGRMQPILNLPQGRLVATHIESTLDNAGHSPWDKRGWTLQEFILSRRCLVFSNYHVSMKCQEEFFHDALSVNAAADRVRTRLNAEHFWENAYAINLHEQKWNFQTFDALVSIYSARELRYPGDILRACQGSLNQITHRTGVAFTAGLPVAHLHQALLWKRHNQGQLCYRGSHDFPSWSWAGWRGRIEYDYWVTDMAGYIDQDASDAIKILNRKGRKRARMDDRVTTSISYLRHAGIVSWPTADEPGTVRLRMLTSMATCKAERVYATTPLSWSSEDGVEPPLGSRGSLWTILDPDTEHGLSDIAGNGEVFAKQDHLFSLDITTARRLTSAGGRSELLMISYWPLIRDSERSNQWLQDMVSCMVVKRNTDQTVSRIAVVLLEEQVWQRFNPKYVEVTIV